MKKTFKIIVKLGTLSLPSGAVVFFGGDRRRQPRDGTMLDETPAAYVVTYTLPGDLPDPYTQPRPYLKTPDQVPRDPFA